MAKVLIVDDSEFVAGIWNSILTQAGHEVHVAHNGNDGVQEALLHLPDVVLMDVKLPDIDGFEACARIVDTPGAEGVRVLFLSASEASLTDDLVAEAGGVGHLNKQDVTPESLVGMVEKALQA